MTQTQGTLRVHLALGLVKLHKHTCAGCPDAADHVALPVDNGADTVVRSA